MINIRFHLVSLVAVFLALGVGVVMGASFIDRATVESMRSRVDDLESGFRDRGTRLGDYEDLVRTNDDAAVALGDEASRAIDGSLDGTSVVLVLPTGLPEGTAEVVADTLVNAGASVAGTLQLQPALDPAAEGALGDEQLDALRAVLDAADADAGAGAEGGDADGEDGAGAGGSAEDLSESELVEEAADALAAALATLSAAPPTADGTGDGTEGTAEGSEGTAEGSEGTAEGSEGTAEGSEGTAQGSEDAVATAELEAARNLVLGLGEAGLVSLETGGLPAEQAFPSVTGERYVVVASADSEPSSEDWVVPFVEEYGARSLGTMVVAEVAPLRPAGELPPEQDGAPQDSVFDPLRTGSASNEVSTVASAAEPLARLAVAYALAAQADGIVGHYGLGDGATAPYPPAARE